MLPVSMSIHSIRLFSLLWTTHSSVQDTTECCFALFSSRLLFLTYCLQTKSFHIAVNVSSFNHGAQSIFRKVWCTHCTLKSVWIQPRRACWPAGRPANGDISAPTPPLPAAVQWFFANPPQPKYLTNQPAPTRPTNGGLCMGCCCAQ